MNEAATPASVLEGEIARFESQRRATLARSRAATLLWALALSALLYWCFHVGGLFDPKTGDALPRVARFLDQLNPHLKPDALFGDRQTPGSLAYWYYDAPHWLRLAKETVEMAVLGTALGAGVALSLCAFSARNLIRVALVRFVVRRTFEVLRTTPEFILAILLTAAFGGGALAGVIALAVSTVGGLGKLFTEVLESADTRPVEAVRAAGGGWAAQVRYGVLPQAAPMLVSYALLRLEVNLAAAAALGIVGAGGIGLELERAITYSEFSTYSALLILIIAMIFVIDIGSEAIRHRLIGRGER